MTYLEREADGATWFFRAVVAGRQVLTTSGLLGSPPRAQTRAFPTPGEAQVHCDERVAEQRANGFVEAKDPLPPPPIEVLDGLPGVIRYFEGKLGPGWILLDDGRSVHFELAALEGITAMGFGDRILVKDVTPYRGQRAEDLHKGKFEATRLRPLPKPAPVPGPRKTAREPRLEQKILESPDDSLPYLIYADWLQSKGDRRGELIAIQHARSLRDSAGLREREQHLLTTNHWFLGEPIDLGGPVELELRWHWGLLRGVRIRSESGEGDPGPLLLSVLRSPPACALQTLGIGVCASPDADHQPLIDAVTKARPPLRELAIADAGGDERFSISRIHLGDFERLFRAVPLLQKLVLRGTGLELGKLDLPELRQLTFNSDGLSSHCLESVCGAVWPSLTSLQLELDATASDAGENPDLLVELLQGTNLPQLRHLGLINARLADQLIEPLARSALLPRLRTLDLSRGSLGEAGAQALLRNADAFRHLLTLDLSANDLSAQAGARLQGLCGEVII